MIITRQLGIVRALEMLTKVSAVFHFDHPITGAVQNERRN
jgi:hypothetical protein